VGPRLPGRAAGSVPHSAEPIIILYICCFCAAITEYEFGEESADHSQKRTPMFGAPDEPTTSAARTTGSHAWRRQVGLLPDSLYGYVD